MNCTELRKAISKANTEGLNVEFKQQIPSPAKFARSVAAIANTTSGGTLYIGVDEDNEDKAVIKGVPYDKQIHNKDRIANILSDRIQPNITNLEVEVIRLRRKNTCVFVISIPPTSSIYAVNEDKARRYYIRRAGRTEELIPTELMELAHIKQNYRDNMKTRDMLLSIVNGTKDEFARLLDLSIEEFPQYLEDAKMFRSALGKAVMKNLSLNLLDEFYDIRHNIDYALNIPHRNLTIEEQECIQDILNAVENHVPTDRDEPSRFVLSLDELSVSMNLSLVERIKSALSLHSATKEELWNELLPMFHSYGLTYQAFLDKIRSLGVDFDQYDDDNWSNHFRLEIRMMYNELSKLSDVLETMQSKFGTFKTE